MSCLEMTKRVKGEQKLKGGSAYLSVSPDRAAAVAEQLGHVVVVGELPQTGLQVEVPVEPQGAGSPEVRAVLVRRRLTNHLLISGGLSDEGEASLGLGVIQQVGAAVVAHAGAVGAQRELKVGEGPR